MLFDRTIYQVIEQFQKEYETKSNKIAKIFIKDSKFAKVFMQDMSLYELRIVD